ncbi:MAG: transposase [Desulfomonile sp.]|nr:transposase [Desulfomonile sp.]
MGVRKPMLTDEQWEKIRPLIPPRPPRPKGGRPPADDRACLEGILWILKTGAGRQDLPAEYPDSSTCWRRLRDRYEAGVFVKKQLKRLHSFGRGFCVPEVCSAEVGKHDAFPACSGNEHVQSALTAFSESPGALPPGLREALKKVDAQFDDLISQALPGKKAA